MNSTEQQIEATLNSLAAVGRAGAPPFLAGQVLRKIKEKVSRSFWEKGAEIIARPSIALTFMAVVLMLNLYFLFLTPESKNEISSTIPGYDYTVTDFPNEDENIWP